MLLDSEGGSSAASFPICMERIRKLNRPSISTRRHPSVSFNDVCKLLSPLLFMYLHILYCLISSIELLVMSCNVSCNVFISPLLYFHLVFQKKATLFGADVAAPYSKASDFTLIVEGYFDVLALHEAGMRAVVASMGTAVSLAQLAQAATLSKSGTVILLLDGDEAGKEAVNRVLKLLAKPVNKRAKDSKESSSFGEQLSTKSFTLKVASLSDSLRLIEELKTRKEANSSNEKEIAPKSFKDCADICTYFDADDAKTIISDVIAKAKVVHAADG